MIEKTLLDEFVKGARFDQFSDEDVFVPEVDEKPAPTVDLEPLSYLEPKPSCMGGVGLDFDKIGAVIGKGERSKWVTVGDEFRKASGCMKTALKFERVKDGVTFYNFIKCWRWVCSECGKKHGRIHRKRVSRIISRVARVFKEHCMEGYEGEDIDVSKGVLDLRQLVFTVPMEVREYFMTRKDMQAYLRLCERVVKKEFPNKHIIRYFHAFGEKSGGLYNPHANFHIFEYLKTALKLSPEKLKSIKARYVSALSAYILQVHKKKVSEKVWEKIDIHYQFLEGDKVYRRKDYNAELGRYEPVEVEGIKLIMHRIEYMSRPWPGYAVIDKIKNNEYLLRLFVVEMKGFCYITNCGAWKIQDGNRKEERQEMEEKAEGRLRICRDNEGHILYISREEFNLLYKDNDYKELSDGFYEIVNEGRKKKKEKKK